MTDLNDDTDTSVEPLELQPGGTLVPDKHVYIERDADDRVVDLLARGQYVNILTSRQMGKSSLVMRARRHLRDRLGVRSAYIDLTQLGSPDNAERYFRGLTQQIARSLKVPLVADAFWAEEPGLTASQTLVRFFREVVLEAIQGPVVVFLDEIDSTLKLAYTDDLFLALRSIYNERAIEPAYGRLAFCLIGVATPNELIKDRRTTPYNVGETLELRDFDRALDDLSPLEAALGREPAAAASLLDRVLYWTGGHPYLTVLLCQRLALQPVAGDAEVDRAVAGQFEKLDRVRTDTHFAPILAFLDERLTHGAQSLETYGRLLDGKRVPDTAALALAELKLSGLVKRALDGNLAIRNRLYARLFDKAWLATMRPLQAAAEQARTARLSRRVAIAAGLALIVGAGSFAVYDRTTLAPLRQEEAARQTLQRLGVTITGGGAQPLRFDFPGNIEEPAPQVTDDILQAAVPAIATILARSPETPAALEIAGTSVSSVEPIAGLRQLQWLDLSYTPVSSLEPVAGLRQLEWLDLSNTPVSSLEPIADLGQLQYLHLSNTPVSSLEPVAALGQLQGLNLSDTSVSSLEPVAGLGQLEWLALSNTPVSSLEPVAGLGQLRELYLSNTPVSPGDPVLAELRGRGVDVRGP